MSIKPGRKVTSKLCPYVCRVVVYASVLRRSLEVRTRVRVFITFTLRASGMKVCIHLLIYDFYRE